MCSYEISYLFIYIYLKTISLGLHMTNYVRVCKYLESVGRVHLSLWNLLNRPLSSRSCGIWIFILNFRFSLFLFFCTIKFLIGEGNSKKIKKNVYGKLYISKFEYISIVSKHETYIFYKIPLYMDNATIYILEAQSMYWPMKKRGWQHKFILIIYIYTLSIYLYIFIMKGLKKCQHKCNHISSSKSNLSKLSILLIKKLSLDLPKNK